MAISRLVRQHIEKLGINLTKEQETELGALPEPLQSDKLITLITRDQAKSLMSSSVEDLRRDRQEMDKANNQLEQALKQQEEIVRIHQDKVKKIKESYTSILGSGADEVIHKMGDNLDESVNLLNAKLDSVEKKAREKIASSKELIAKLEAELSSNAGRNLKEIETAERIKERLEKEKESITTNREILASANELKNKHKENAAEIKNENASLLEQEKILTDIGILLKSNNKLTSELSSMAEQTEEHFTDFMRAISPEASQYSKTIFSSLAAQMMIINQGTDGFVDRLKTMGQFMTDKISKVFTDAKSGITGFFDYLYSQSIGKAFELSKVFAEANKQSGGFGLTNQRITMTGSGSAFGIGNLATDQRLSQYGIGINELNKSIVELQNSFKGFNNLSLETQQSVAVMSAKMENLGVSSSQSAKMLELFSSAFGKTIEGAKQQIESMAKDALALGQNVSKYFQEFESVVAKISGFAEKTENIFKRLTAISMETKLSTDKLVGMAEKFKTLEGASDAIGKLNAAFGGVSLQAAELIKMNPADIFIRIREEVEAHGNQFSALNIGMKEYVAEALGLGDVNSAAQGLSGSLSNIRANMDKSTASTKELLDAQKRSASFQEQYKKMLENLTIVAMPLLKLLNNFFTGLNALMEMKGGFILPLIFKFVLFRQAVNMLRNSLISTAVATTAAASPPGIEAATTKQIGLLEAVRLKYDQVRGAAIGATEAEIAAANAANTRIAGAGGLGKGMMASMGGMKGMAIIAGISALTMIGSAKNSDTEVSPYSASNAASSEMEGSSSPIAAEDGEQGEGVFEDLQKPTTKNDPNHADVSLRVNKNDRFHKLVVEKDGGPVQGIRKSLEQQTLTLAKVNTDISQGFTSFKNTKSFDTDVSEQRTETKKVQELLMEQKLQQGNKAALDVAQRNSATSEALYAYIQNPPNNDDREIKVVVNPSNTELNVDGNKFAHSMTNYEVVSVNAANAASKSKILDLVSPVKPLNYNN